jgi:hypothetical protein
MLTPKQSSKSSYEAMHVMQATPGNTKPGRPYLHIRNLIIHILYVMSCHVMSCLSHLHIQGASCNLCCALLCKEGKEDARPLRQTSFANKQKLFAMRPWVCCLQMCISMHIIDWKTNARSEGIKDNIWNLLGPFRKKTKFIKHQPNDEMIGSHFSRWHNFESSNVESAAGI